MVWTEECKTDYNQDGLKLCASVRLIEVAGMKCKTMNRLLNEGV